MTRTLRGETMAKLKGGEPGRAVRLVLSPREHAELRVQAARADLPLAEWCRRAVVAALGLGPEPPAGEGKDPEKGDAE